MENKSINTNTQITTPKKISMITIIMIAVSTCVGAGIYFKNSGIIANNSMFGNEKLSSTITIVLTILSWVFASIGCIALALCLPEIVHNNKYQELGVLGWIKTFCQSSIYRGIKNFLFFIYFPCLFFGISYALVEFLLTGLAMYGCNIPYDQSYFAVIVCLIATIFVGYFVTINIFSNKISIIHNWISSIIKSLPLLFVVIGGFILLGMNNGRKIDSRAMLSDYYDGSFTFVTLLPGLGVLASVPAIMFAFDGFYASTGQFSRLKNPNKSGLALALALVITSAIYIIYSFAVLIVTNNGSLSGFIGFNDSTAWRNLIATIFIFIAISLVGTLNGLMMYAVDMSRRLYLDKEIGLMNVIGKKIKNEKWLLLFVLLTIYCGTVIIFSLISLLCFGKYAGYDENQLGYGVARFYIMGQLLTNWASLLMFSSVGITILFAIINRYKKTIEIKTEMKHFVITGIIGVVIIGLAFVYQLIECIYNLIYFSICSSKDNQIISSSLIPQIILLIIFLVYSLIILFPLIKEKLFKNKKI